MIQHATFKCDCGRPGRVRRVGPYEFHVACRGCGAVYILSWFHDAPPPEFEDPPRLIPDQDEPPPLDPPPPESLDAPAPLDPLNPQPE